MIRTEFDNSSSRKLFTLLRSNFPEIYAVWQSALKERWGAESSRREQMVTQQRVEKRDLFSLILKVLESGESVSGGFIKEFVPKPVDDLLCEISLLERSVEDVLRRTVGISDQDAIRNLTGFLKETLSALVQKTVLAKTKIYEQIVEHGQRGFCLVDESGAIIHANEEMEKLLGPGQLNGKCLPDFFCRDDRGSVLQSFVERQPPVRLQVTNQAGKAVPVGVETGPLNVEGGHPWAYACLIGLAEQKRVEDETYGKFPEGIIRWKMPAPQEPYERATIVYANAKASEMAGYDSLVGKTLKALFPDEKNLREIRAQIAKRQQGKGDEYNLFMTRADGKQIPIRISSVPEMDFQAQRVVGAVTIIRSLEREQAVASIHNIIETSRSSEEIFKGIANVIAEVIPFEHFEVMIYSDDLSYIKRLFPGPEIEPKWLVRWYPTRDEDIEWIKAHNKPEALDRWKLMEDEKFKELKDTEEFKSFPDFHYILLCPLIIEEKTVAAIHLYSNHIYSQNHVDVLKDLPLNEAILLSLYYEEIANAEFKLNLIKNLTLACDDISLVYRNLLKDLSSHYKWQSVALFEVDERADKIRLLDQVPCDASWTLASDFNQKLSGKGILGYVGRSKKPFNTPDVDEDPIAREHYVPGLKKTRSELCVPIKSGFGLWLLNIEDSRKCAFSPEEERSLTQEVLPELEGFLERLSQHYIANFIQNSTSDMVVVTDSLNRIKKINPATTKKLGFGESELTNGPITTLFANPELHIDCFEETIENKEVLFRNSSGNNLKVLLSGSRFPGGINGCFYLAKDITIYDYEKDINCRNDLLDATAARTSLSLIFSWLNSLPDPSPHTTEKIRKQLRKVEMTLDQFALYGRSTEVTTTRIVLEVSEILANLEEQFPCKEYEKISIEPSSAKLVLWGDPFQVLFCITSVLSYLLRYVPEDKKIQLSVKRQGRNLTFGICGFWPEAKWDKHFHTRFEFDLGKRAIQQFMANHNGLFEYRTHDSKITFYLTFPLEGVDHAT